MACRVPEIVLAYASFRDMPLKANIYIYIYKNMFFFLNTLICLMTLCTCSVFSGYVLIWTACEHTHSRVTRCSRVGKCQLYPWHPFCWLSAIHGETNATPYPIRLDASTCLLPKKSSLPNLGDVQHRHKSLVELIGSIIFIWNPR